MSALVTISIDPGATEAGTLNLKSLMVMTAAADAEGVPAAEVFDVAEGEPAEDVGAPEVVGAELEAAEDVGALEVVGAELEDVLEDVAAGAEELAFDPLQAPSARVAPRPQTTIVARAIGDCVMVGSWMACPWGWAGVGTCREVRWLG